jgi:hypothetical protein
MPVRPRRVRRPRHELTLRRWCVLSLGPNPGEPIPQPGTEEWQTLESCWREHGDRMTASDPTVPLFGEGSWGYRVFDAGENPEAVSIRLEPAD